MKAKGPNWHGRKADYRAAVAERYARWKAQQALQPIPDTTRITQRADRRAR